MTNECWNADGAVLMADDELDVLESSAPHRYGETAWESSRDVPLDVALAEEVPELPLGADPFDEWLFISDFYPSPLRLESAEQSAMHVEVPLEVGELCSL